MKKVFKILAIIYFACAFPILFIVADLFILKSNPEIYHFIPQEADIVIELNSKNFIREIAYQRIYNETYFLDKTATEENISIVEDAPLNTGIDFFSQVIIFREKWANEEVWYSVVKIQSKTDFETYIKEKELEINKVFADNYCVIQLTPSINQKSVTEHLEKIAQKQIKSFDAKVDLSTVFEPKNEMNIYISPQNSKHIIDGYLYLNFLKDKIVINGEFDAIGQSEKIPFISYSDDMDKAFSLRSSLNLFNSVYLFNDKKLEDLPDYSQLCLDFNGVLLRTTNDEIPITAYPKINLKFDINNAEIWQNYLNELDNSQGVIIDTVTHSILLDAEAKSAINYILNDTEFSLYQEFLEFSSNNNSSKDYFSLNINPKLFLEYTDFVKDTINPPQMIAKLKIGIIQNMMEDMDYFNSIENVNFTICDAENDIDFKSKGTILFEEKNGNSMVESLVFAQDFIGTIGAFLDME